MAAQPKWETEDTIRAAAQMLELLKKHEAALTEVLAPGAKEGLEADSAELREDSFATGVAKTSAKAATVDQNTLLAQGALQISSWREAIRRTYPEEKHEKIREAFGVGARVATNSVKSVGTAMKLLVEAAQAQPEIAREAAILPSHSEKMAQTRIALVGVDRSQEGKKVSATGATRQREATQVRVERAMERIVAAATMRFMGQPEAKEFADLLPTRSRKVAKKKVAPKPA